MNKKSYENPCFLASLLLLATVVFAFVISIFLALLKLPPSLSSLAGLLAAMFIGHTYAANVKKDMPKKLRLRTTIIYSGIQFVITLMFYLLMRIFTPLLVLIIIGFVAVYGVLVYLMLGIGVKNYLKSAEK